jgi:DNA gyrase subunit B
MTYNSDDILVLGDIEGIRKRPSMYIKSTGSAGLHQLVDEVLDNAVDEHLAGRASKVKVTIDGSKVTIADNGRGIPGGIHKQTGISTLTTIFTTTHSGGKFEKRAYAFSGGLHGVGGTVVNALSKRLRVVSYRGRHRYMQEFKQGVPVGEARKAKNKKQRTGTTISFIPDSSVMKGSIEPEKVAARMQEVAHLCGKLTLTLEAGGKSRTFKGSGLKGMVRKHVKSKVTLHKPVKVTSEAAEIVFVWTDAPYETWASFVNVTRMEDGGTQVTGMRRAISTVLGGLTDGAVDGNDLRDGLVVASHFMVDEPEFKGQAKSKLLNKDVGQQAYEIMVEALTSFVEDNSKVAQQIVKHAIKLGKGRARTRKIRESLRTTKGRKRGLLPTKLAEAPDARPRARELFIVEGDSAGGSAKAARDTRYQEVLPLRGKVVNAMRSRDATVLKNAEFKAMITAIGCGIDHDASTGCNPKKARVGKVLLLMDADPDGAHIVSLILSFLTQYMKPLIEAGMVAVVQSPLFKGQYKGKQVFGDTYEDIYKAFPKAAKSRVQVNRLKGHGEANPAEIRRYAMDPRTRNTITVKCTKDTVVDVEALMGTDATARKQLLGIEE